MEHESDDDNSCNWCSWYGHKRINTGTGGLRNKSTSGDHKNYSIIKINQNIEKSSWDLRRLAITQTLLKTHEVTVARKKTLKRV